MGRFEIPVAFTGKCGQGSDGLFLKNELATYMVSCERLIADHAARAPRAFIVAARGSGKRTVILHKTKLSALASDQIDPSIFDGAKYLLLDAANRRRP